MAKTPEIDLRENYGKNYIMNGDMRIAQRGTSFPSIAHLAYSLDRYKYEKGGGTTAVHTVTQDTDVPTVAQAGYLFQNSMRLNLTTPDTATAAGEFVFFEQYIEGNVLTGFAQKQFTLSFWVKATLTGTYCVALLNSDNSRTYVAEYTINASETWEYKTITVAATPSGGNWNYSNGAGLRVCFILAAGSTFQGTGNQWNTSLFLATANQVNGVNTGATNFRLTGLQLNEGPTALPFRTFSSGSVIDELAACQRYFELLPMRWRYTISSGTGEVQCYYKVTKRAIPTITSSTADSVSAENSGSGNGLESVRLSMTANTTNGIITADAEL